MKSDRILEHIKERTDIVEFISNYVQLRKSGQNWKGLCPFHAEKTPSFMVSPSKQIFHCFGCGSGGDVISFLVQYERMTFSEAVKMLARRAGIPLPALRQDRKAIEKDEQIRLALSDASEYYRKMLRESKRALSYVRSRGITDESRDLFGLGYAPPGWQNLVNRLRNAGYSDAVLKESGLAVAGEKGLYDMFRGRIIFPIAGTNGNVIAFGGRAMDDALPKYINSPETAVFRKFDTLYGLSTAKEALRHKGCVLIVEGYMDVIICHQYGFRNVVAPLGTSLTAGHLQRLRSLTRDAVMVFDGDQAGKAAAQRALPLLCQHDFNCRVLVLPDGEDPDSYLRKHGAEAFGLLIEDAGSMIDFLLRTARGRKVDAVKQALALIGTAGDRLEADEMLMELAGKTRISEMTLREEFRKMKTRSTGDAVTKQPPGTAARKTEEHLLLSAVIAFPQKAEGVLSRIDAADMKDPAIASLFRRIAAAPDRENLASILVEASDGEKKIFTMLSVEPGFDLEHVDRNIEDCVLKIEKRNLEERLHHAQAAGDIKLFQALLMERKKIIKGKDHERL